MGAYTRGNVRMIENHSVTRVDAGGTSATRFIGADAHTAPATSGGHANGAKANASLHAPPDRHGRAHGAGGRLKRHPIHEG